MSWSIVQADALEFLRSQPDGSLDLVFGSPPYEQARLYLEGGTNMGISRKTREWVAWMADVHEAAQRACKGLVAFVVAGQTKNFRWSAGPATIWCPGCDRGVPNDDRKLRMLDGYTNAVCNECWVGMTPFQRILLAMLACPSFEADGLKLGLSTTLEQIDSKLDKLIERGQVF